MRSKPVAKRYAKAIFESWEDKLSSLHIKNKIFELQSVWHLISSNTELRVVWISSGFSKQEKDLLVSLFETQGVFPEVVRVLRFLVKQRRCVILPDVLAELVELFNRSSKIIPVTVISSAVLSGSDVAEVKRSVKELRVTEGMNCEFHFDVDPNIMGGIVVQLGQYVYNCSALSTFNRLVHKIETLGPRELNL
jgi:ATP synthase F1 delta subunit